MSDEGSAFVRGFGDLAGSRGGIAWSLAGGGAVSLEGEHVAATDVDAVSGESGGWTFDTRLDGDPLQGAATFRHIAVDAPDRTTIACTAIGRQGIPGHGEERITGALYAGGEEIPYEEALISTQYDGDGNPTRFGLELWPQEADQTSRAAATRVSASILGGARVGTVWAGFFRCHTDGAEGIGTYLLSRR